MTDSNSAQVSEIPTVDMSGFISGDPDGKQMAARQLRNAMEKVGFFFLVGHGIDWSIIDEAYLQVKRFFDQPLEDKMEVKVGTGGPDSTPLLAKQRGYIHYRAKVDPVTAEKSERAKNFVEAFNMAREDYGINQWPSNLPGFRDALLKYYQTMYDLATDMVRLYALALDLPETYFDPFFDRAGGSMRISHYFPAQSEAELADSWGIHPHTDRSFLTLLPANKVSGLQVRPEGADWIEAPYVPGSFVVNGGDILKRWTNDRFLSTPHRVVRSMSERYAMPLFFSPDNDITIEVVPTCYSPDHPLRYAPISHQDFLSEFLQSDYTRDDERLKG